MVDREKESRILHPKPASLKDCTMIPKPYQVKISILPLELNGIELLIYEAMCIQQVNRAINKWLYEGN